MDISFYNKDNRKKLAPISGGYEWWYADFIDKESGLSGVFIFYYGNLFSPEYVRKQQLGTEPLPEDYPAMSVSLYNNEKPVYYSFIEYQKEQASYHEIDGEVRYQVGDDYLHFSSKENVLNIVLNQNLPNGSKLALNIYFEGFQPLIDHGQELDKSSRIDASHDWRCIFPKAKVKGELSLNNLPRVTIKKALGYHDHNMGIEPLHHFFSDWYWGRCHFEKSAQSLVYYAYLKDGEYSPNAWLIADNSMDVESLTDLRFSQSTSSIFGLKRSKTIEIANRFTIKVKSLVDKGPFYERYFIEAIDKQTNEIETGFAEYIRPEAIYFKWVHPLVNMRMQYTYKKPSWILKSMYFHKLTWNSL